MKTNRKLLIGALSAAGIAMVAGTVFSAPPYGGGFGPCQQGAGMQGSGYGMQGRGPGHGGPGFQRGMWQQGDPLARIETLKSELKITAEQEPAWDKFVTNMQQHRALRDQHRQERQAGGALGDVRLNAVERFDQHIARMSAGLANMSQTQANLKGLYEVLDADQREVLDRLAVMRHGMRGF